MKSMASRPHRWTIWDEIRFRRIIAILVILALAAMVAAAFLGVPPGGWFNGF